MSRFNQRYLEFSKPFVDAIKDVYKTMIGVEVVCGTPQIKKDTNANGSFSSIMGMSGTFEAEGVKKNFKGTLIITWEEQCYLKTAGKMLMEEYTEINDAISDVGLEICNITMGNAKKVLNPIGYKIEMSIPSSVSGEGHLINCDKGVTAIVLPFKNEEIGQLTVELHYIDSDSEI